MHEASNQIYAPPRWYAARPRWLVVVSAESQSKQPSAPHLIECLVAVARAKDRPAFAVLFQYFAPRLKTFFLRGSLPAGTSEDLVQETMLNVWRKAAMFDPSKASVSTWVFAIARNLRIDHLRRQRNPDDLPSESGIVSPLQEDAVLGAEREARVRVALAGLSEEQSTIIRMSYFSEKSQAEIANELSIPLGTVKSRTRLAMNRLRALLEDQS
jgi:RNA polymerase sigma-70 factor (ECF subfamily)